MKKVVTLKLGGSVIFKKGTAVIDFEYLGLFRDFLKKLINEGLKFTLNVGGGKLSEVYQKLASGQSMNPNDVNWIGTAATVMNAYLIRGSLGDELCEKDVFKFSDYDSSEEFNFTKDVLVAGGSGPGYSNEYNALLLAQKLGNKEVFVLKDVNGVYDSDPDTNKNAKMIENLSWDEYIEIIGNPKGFIPKSAFPVDIVAARKAKEDAMVFHILSGKDFENLEKAIKGANFTGTTIS